MVYSPLLIVHILGGLAALVSGSVALVVRKGSRLHKMSGNVFVIAMLGMAASGGSLALIRGQRLNVLAGAFTIYLVSTAWLTVRRRPGQAGRAEFGLMLGALVIAAIAFFYVSNPIQGAHRGDPTAGFVVFASLALLSAGSDLRVVLRGGIRGAQRIVRHVWRMGFALFITAGSFFLGMPGDPVLRKSGLRARLFNQAVRDTHLPALPVVIVAVLTLYWIFRVRISAEYKPREVRSGAPTRREVAP